jgi:hypothetical protein
MTILRAYCGLDCATCEAYQATQADDAAWKERIAAQWRVEYNNPNFNIMTVTCDGCTSTSGRLGGYCPACPVRACAIEHGVENCALCPDYDCETIRAFFQVAPQLKDTLDALRG